MKLLTKYRSGDEMNIINEQERRIFFLEFKEVLLKAAKAVIYQFSQGESNRNTYAFCIYAHESYGSISFWINTEESLLKTLKSTYPKEVALENKGFRSLKYNSGDFSYYYEPEKLVSSLSNYSDIYCNTMMSDEEIDPNIIDVIYRDFVDMLISLIKDVKKECNVLNVTDDFIAFIDMCDRDASTSEMLMRSSITNKVFDKLFPEMKEYESHVEKIKLLKPKNQVKYWLDIYVSDLLGHNNEDLNYIRKLGRHKYDVEYELSKLSDCSWEYILSNIESFIYLEEINYEDNMSFKERLKFMKTIPANEKYKYKRDTIESEVSIDLMYIIEKHKILSKDVMNGLLEIQRKLFLKSKNKNRIGSNLQRLSRTIHRLQPKIYPEPVIDSKTNHLLNYDKYNVNNE